MTNLIVTAALYVCGACVGETRIELQPVCEATRIERCAYCTAYQEYMRALRRIDVGDGVIGSVLIQPPQVECSNVVVKVPSGYYRIVDYRTEADLSRDDRSEHAGEESANGR